MEFDFATIGQREGYALLVSLVVPRPIALVTTLNRDGSPNAAPFSFYNCMGYDPPVLALGLEANPDNTDKDTAANIARTGEFVVHLVSESMAEAMNICAVDFPPGINELAEAGLTTQPSRIVAPPRIAESPAAFECRRLVDLGLGRNRTIVIGQVLLIHARDDVVAADGKSIDSRALRAIGRMDGPDYVRTTDRFSLSRMTKTDYRGRRP